MEVHAHTHTARKKWTHYLWEFLMLFLAVFCGFLAEYKLEHTIEHQREKEYAKALYDELYADSIVFSNKIKAYGSTCTHTYCKKKMDTLFLGISHVVSCRVLWIPR